MEPTKKTYWITKYVLTDGIMEGTGKLFGDTTVSIDKHWRMYRLGTDVFDVKEEAIARAKKMITKKLASLDKQRAKLLKMAEELR